MYCCGVFVGWISTVNNFILPYKWKYWQALNLPPNWVFKNVCGIKFGSGLNLTDKDHQVLNVGES